MLLQLIERRGVRSVDVVRRPTLYRGKFSWQCTKQRWNCRLDKRSDHRLFRRTKLIADDGKFLGDASSNKFAADGVCNEFSNYGSQFGTDSIFNEFGLYGSQFGSLSAYDEFTSTPPFLFCPGANVRLNPVTKNKFLGGAIDPDVLCAVLQANGY